MVDNDPTAAETPSGDEPRPHPRRITWVGASSLALGGSNQSIFLIGALLASQGSATVPLLALGLVLSYLATPSWIELSCMFPNRVGGIAATCAEAFRPYSSVLANLAGVCYWWGWVPTCGLTALLSAQAIHDWYLPGVNPTLLAVVLVLLFMGVNLCGLKWAVRVAKPIALAAGLLALGATIIPIYAGQVNWHTATTFHLTSIFGGTFGHLTSAMAGLYLIGFAAPAFEAAACHIGEMKRPAYDQPRAMWVSGGVASIYFVLIPVVWLGIFGATHLQAAASARGLDGLLGPTFAPLLGGAAKSAAVWFVALNMFSGTLQPLSGASRTLSQLSEDSLLPRSIGYRHPRTDAPVVAIVVTAVASIIFLLFDDPAGLIAAANLTYLIGIALPSVAVWILRRHEPDLIRTYRARDISIKLGVLAAFIWLVSTMLGFEQFGLPVVIFGMALAYSGSLAYAWRLHFDRKASGHKAVRRSIHLKLTGAMLAVLTLDALGYLIAVNHVPTSDVALVAMLKDLFVTVGLLTISVGLILPGMIAHAANQVAEAADDLARGTLNDLTLAMEALANDDLQDAHARVTIQPVQVRTSDEFGAMADTFNVMQGEAARVAVALDHAAAELRAHRENLEHLVVERTAAMVSAHEMAEAANRRRQAALLLIEERDRIARDLHDTVIQRLFAVGLHLQGTLANSSDHDVTRRIENAVGNLDETVRDLRSAIYELERTDPSAGFRTSVALLIKELGAVLPGRPNVSFSGEVDALVTDEVAHQALAILREALTNIGKHAEATTIDVAIAAEDELAIVIVDDGRGLPDLSANTEGHGLKNMRKRAELLGGELELLTPEDGGTCLIWSVPLSQTG